jgi:signal peptidase complex subunit 2
MAKDEDRADGGLDEGQEEEVKIDKWDGAAVKNSLDDAVKRVLTEGYNYQESHKLMDIRLAICLTAVGSAMLALAYDFLHPFPASRSVLISCVVGYFILMAVLTVYTTFVEKGIFLVTLNKDPTGIDPTSTWTVSSCLKRFDDIYHLCLEHSDGKSGSKQIEATLSKSVSHWFDENGLLLRDKFEAEVCKLHDSLKTDKKNK